MVFVCMIGREGFLCFAVVVYITKIFSLEELCVWWKKKWRDVES